MLGKILKRDKRDKLDKEIDDVLEEMTYQDKAGSRYAKNVDTVERLYRAKSYIKSRKVSPDTKAIILANLIGILAILHFEKVDTITSKAFNFVLRGRV